MFVFQELQAAIAQFSGAAAASATPAVAAHRVTELQSRQSQQCVEAAGAADVAVSITCNGLMPLPAFCSGSSTNPDDDPAVSSEAASAQRQSTFQGQSAAVQNYFATAFQQPRVMQLQNARALACDSANGSFGPVSVDAQGYATMSVSSSAAVTLRPQPLHMDSGLPRFLV